ncbi:MAG: ATP-binding protein [Ignavibacteriales bacterium]|nr:ATP-binding protein [Ignavibacteriales bacterium]
MRGVSFRTRLVITISSLIVILVGAALYLNWSTEQSRSEVVETHKQMTQRGLQQLTTALAPTLDSLVRSGFFSKRELTRSEEKHVDTLLAKIAGYVLNAFKGMEGGCYVAQFDQFMGYSFPTSPEPKPAYGPPPRSYHIIRHQVLLSIAQKSPIVEVHTFDPATFPLVTEPLVVRGQVLGGVWARIHIERLMPTVSLVSVLLGTAFILLLGLIGALVAVWRFRTHVEQLRLGLQTLHNDSAFRFVDISGVFGYIEHSINEMVDARALEQHRRAELEAEVHQQDKLASLGKLVARVAHEVKTPLAIVKTRIQMWERKFRKTGNADGVVSRDSMDLVLQEIDRLSDLVKRLLVFSKPIVNKRTIVDVNDLLRHIVALVQGEIDERNISLGTTFEKQLPTLSLDIRAMEQVFLNIVTNALEAMADGGELEMTTRYFKETNEVSVSIQDSGKGIPDEIRTKVFDPFFTTKEQGTGLGLSIAYEIVHAHHGKITFSEAGAERTTCTITLPVGNAK